MYFLDSKIKILSKGKEDSSSSSIRQRKLTHTSFEHKSRDFIWTWYKCLNVSFMLWIILLFGLRVNAIKKGGRNK